MFPITTQPEEVLSPRSHVCNRDFDPHKGFVLGRSRPVFALWYVTKCLFFLSPWPWPSAFKSALLRLFGAKIGRQVYWKPRVNIHIPWKLEVGELTWIGEETCIYNYAPVKIGSHCCLSQRSLICAANHDYTATSMDYRHTPVRIDDGVWVGAQAFVGPGVHLGVDCVVNAGSVVTKNLPGRMVCAGHPCQPIRHRWKNEFFQRE